MATPITASISNNLDDAVQKSGGATSTSTDDLSFGPSKGFRHCGLRFRDDIDDLNGVTVTSATLTFRATASDNGSFSGTMFVESADAPAEYSISNNDLTGRAVLSTGIPITGTILGSTTNGQDFTLNITVLMNELAASSTNSSIISLIYIHTSGNGQRVFESFDNSGINPVQLSVAYTSSGNATFAAKEAKNVSITNPSSIITAAADFAAKEAKNISITNPSSEITAVSDTVFLAIPAITIPTTGIRAITPVIVSTVNFEAIPAITVLSAVTAPKAVIFAGDADIGDFGNIERTIDRSEYEDGVVFYLEVTMNTNNALFPAKAHLFNVTDTVEVVGSEVTTTSTSAKTVRSNMFGLAGSKNYKVRLGGETGAEYTMYAADVLVDWTRT